MYTILLKNDKSLVASKKTVIYQSDNYYDDLVFLIPHTLDDNTIELFDCTVLLTYKDPGNVVHQEILSVVDTNYKEAYTKYVLPVSTEITKFAGEIEITLAFIKPIIEDESFNVVMHSGPITVTVSPLSNQYATTDMSSFEGITKAIANLDSRLNVTANRIPTDLTINDDDLLQLSTEMDTIGNGVRVFAPSDEVDVNADGMTDLDEVYEDDETVSDYEDADGEDDYNYNTPSDVSWEMI